MRLLLEADILDVVMFFEAAGVTSSLLAYAYSGLQFLWRTATNDTCPLKKPHRLLRTSLDKLALHF